MINVVTDIELKRLIKRRAIRNGCNPDGGFVKYGGCCYYVHLLNDVVVLQNMYKHDVSLINGHIDE